MFFDYERLVELKGIRHELQCQTSLMKQAAFEKDLDNFIKRRANMTEQERKQEDREMWKRWIGE